MSASQRPFPGVPVVDADGHILEPRDLWQRELPDKFKDLAIKIVWNEATQKEDEFVQNVNVAPGVTGVSIWMMPSLLTVTPSRVAPCGPNPS